MCDLLIPLFLLFSLGSAHAQQTRLLSANARASVVQIEISSGKSYSQSRAGSVWIALDPVTLVTRQTSQERRRPVKAGEAAIISSGEELRFEAGTTPHARVVIVTPKTTHQQLTLDAFLEKGTLEDASDRNATLLVALSDSRFREMRNLGGESEWVPSKPKVVMMKAGSVKWVSAGIYHFRNLGSTSARLVSIEW